jgi:hypothetical protein
VLRGFLIEVLVGRRRDSDLDILVVMVIKQRRRCVSNVRMTEKRTKAQKMIQRGFEVYRNPATLSVSGGGAAASGSGQPGGVELGLWVSMRGGEGVLYGGRCVAEGVGFRAGFGGAVEII